MPKLKTKKSASKRFKFTKNGKVKRNKAYKSHILTKKTRERKRNYKKSAIVNKSDMNHIREMLPYGS